MNTRFFPFALLLALAAWPAPAEDVILPPPDESEADDVEIILEEDRTIFEYRQNGVLMMIKIVPENGRPYYMVPGEGAPHYESLNHKQKLYPSWVILEW